jgi:hypothetical protein
MTNYYDLQGAEVSPRGAISISAGLMNFCKSYKAGDCILNNNNSVIFHDKHNYFLIISINKDNCGYWFTAFNFYNLFELL